MSESTNSEISSSFARKLNGYLMKTTVSSMVVFSSALILSKLLFPMTKTRFLLASASGFTASSGEVKLGSSPGLDGYTHVILKFLWPLIGHVLAKGFEVMVEKEELYPNLRTASIKLIPKKGNCEQIKNWRPISLLSNVYKI